jgi:hypothetical protein
MKVLGYQHLCCSTVYSRPAGLMSDVIRLTAGARQNRCRTVISQAAQSHRGMWIPVVGERAAHDPAARRERSWPTDGKNRVRSDLQGSVQVRGADSRV